MTKKNDSRTRWSNHVVNFISVLMGVIIAFSLQSWNETYERNKKIAIALDNIANEIRSNIVRIDSVIIENQAQVAMNMQYLELVDENFEIKVTDEEWREFASEYPQYFDLEERSMSIDFDLFLLSRVAWQTTERMDILSSLDFELAAELAKVYELQKNVEQFDQDIIEKFSQLSSDKTAPLRQLLRNVRLRLRLATSLRDNVYPELLNRLEKVD